MYSVNIPVPPPVRNLASQLRPALSGFDRIRQARSRTLVLKRLPATDRREYLEAARRAKSTLSGTPPFEISVTGIDTFRHPPRGPGPVAYLAVEGTELYGLHDRLVDEFSPVQGLEGPDYVPHITLARGGSGETADRLETRSIEPVRITVDTLELYDSTHGERVESIPLPA